MCWKGCLRLQFQEAYHEIETFGRRVSSEWSPYHLLCFPLAAAHHWYQFHLLLHHWSIYPTPWSLVLDNQPIHSKRISKLPQLFMRKVGYLRLLPFPNHGFFQFAIWTSVECVASFWANQLIMHRYRVPRTLILYSCIFGIVNNALKTF